MVAISSSSRCLRLAPRTAALVASVGALASTSSATALRTTSGTTTKVQRSKKNFGLAATSGTSEADKKTRKAKNSSSNVVANNNKNLNHAAQQQGKQRKSATNGASSSAASSASTSSASLTLTKVDAELPDVKTVMTPATETVNKMQVEVLKLNARIAQLATHDRSRLERSKAELEKKLQVEKAEIEEVRKQNEELRKENNALVKDSEILQVQGQQILAEDDGLRKIIGALQKKVITGADFASKIDSETRDISEASRAPEVDLLRLDMKSTDIQHEAPTEPVQSVLPSEMRADAPPVFDAEAGQKEQQQSLLAANQAGGAGATSFLSVRRSDDHHAIKADKKKQEEAGRSNAGTEMLRHGTSKLQKHAKKSSKTSAKKTKYDPVAMEKDMSWAKEPEQDKEGESMLTRLKSELTQLQAEENKSLDSLRAVFSEKSAKLALEKTHQLNEQEELLQKQLDLKKRRRELRTAVDFVSERKRFLGDGLTHLSAYLKQLAHIAGAPPVESDVSLAEVKAP
ncbi:unnamed protein product [Amoebophrya sp. A120]|nr:unnamed protein product [Amoebophrya sp. A120]|eukprot:GSA120T00002905001.1